MEYKAKTVNRRKFLRGSLPDVSWLFKQAEKEMVERDIRNGNYQDEAGLVALLEAKEYLEAEIKRLKGGDDEKVP